MTTTLRQDVSQTSRDILVEDARTRRHRRLWTPAFLLAILVTLILVVLSLLTGQFDVFGGENWENFWMFGITRVPRTVALVLAGAAMAMSGVIMQLLTQNRFVEPSTMGTTEWAGLGLILVMWLVPAATLFERMIGAVIMSFIGTMVFFLFLRRVSLKSSLIVPIIGIMLGAVVSSFTTYLALMTDRLQTLGIWFQGSFTGVIQGRYELLWIVAGVTVLVFLVADQFTVAGLGRDMATNVGLNYAFVLFLGTAMVAVATGVTATVVGTLPFLGLVVPNIVALIRGDDLRTNLPWVVLVGICTVTVCDLIGRVIIAPFEIPVGMVLGLVGGTVFLGLLLRQRRKGGLVS
ncbi:ABC transporter permease [Nesterenkonia flava]|uniref:Iron chelate uptake ABC transporter family permease subunit n=1 Tax=Nesterenkonia flava TaxID=469799 RepID=A0ABU1FQH4_9MICC|nr:iron chelate uptake ABC transporter family permease subunit [Nesterenkonia flava]MDR5710889.1 iron chelate uptake ABC transporter family permease subunit [Nesterenkonia flava]